MNPFEIKLVRQYAINEIAGGLALGNFALKSENPYVRSQLTYHAMDEFRHGWLWTDFLNKQKVGVASAKGGNEYFDFTTAQEDEINFLAAVHIYELRIPFHLETHMQLPQINPELKVIMKGIADDEKFHLGWIRDYLIDKMKDNPQEVINAVKRSEQIENQTYLRYINHIKKYGGYIEDLATLVESKLGEFPTPSDYFTSFIKNESRG